MGETIVPAGMPPEVVREIREAMKKNHREMKITQSMTMGSPTDHLVRGPSVPDGAVEVKEGGIRESLGFVLKARDLPRYGRITYEFQGAKVAGMAFNTHRHPSSPLVAGEHRCRRAGDDWNAMMDR